MSTLESGSKTTSTSCTVYFDGACPICSKEISTYQKLKGGDHIQWVDASVCQDQELGDELNRQSALARLHVRDAQGKLVHGAAAFVEMWKHLPALSWVTPLLSNRIAIGLLDLAYNLFLRLRPLWRKA
ncbi:thiol-disulfide oxidoreductase DCC family protein [Undibacterium sp. RuRC25W]|uniref:thiol-disulfide oxidoreductase DCC family protein n=1 Tax=Undibacterium sp. RuRC25W TaxID=3413047 RepID=UPI003BF39AD4